MRVGESFLQNVAVFVLATSKPNGKREILVLISFNCAADRILIF